MKKLKFQTQTFIVKGSETVEVIQNPDGAFTPIESTHKYFNCKKGDKPIKVKLKQ